MFGKKIAVEKNWETIFREGFKKKNTTNLGFWLKLVGVRGQRGFHGPNLLMVMI